MSFLGDRSTWFGFEPFFLFCPMVLPSSSFILDSTPFEVFVEMFAIEPLGSCVVILSLHFSF